MIKSLINHVLALVLMILLIPVRILAFIIGLINLDIKKKKKKS